MSDLQKLQNQIKNKLLFSVIEGGQRFPVYHMSSPENETPLTNELENLSLKIENCSLCPLSEKRKRVLIEKNIAPKSFFVLSDFPDASDESSQAVYSSQSPVSSIVLNLLNKLEIIDDCHFSFAIKCFPEKGLPENSLSTCAVQNLAKELLFVRPSVILCFGYRALRSLIQLDKNLNGIDFLENAEMGAFVIGNHSSRLFFLPSLRELRDFPHWRRDVWEVLKPLALNASH